MKVPLRTVLVGWATVGALVLSACGSDDDSSSTTAASTVESSSAPSSAEPSAEAAESAFPRTVTHESGETVIPSKPANIVSTSITITGTLLAIGAPVTYSAATNVGFGTDDNGFFTQWADVAAERGVQVLYPNLELDLEAIIAAEPDLIVVSTTGADTVADQYAALSDIAPTVVFNYSDKSWEDLALQLGEATGLESEAAAVVAEFDEYVADAAAKITLPDPATATIVNFSGDQTETGVSKTGSAQAALLTGLGFEVVAAPDEFDTIEQDRQDFAFVSLENLSKSIGGANVFLISAEEADIANFTGNSALANVDAVVNGQVFALGADSFRIDYYSATNVVDRLVAQFG